MIFLLRKMQKLLDKVQNPENREWKIELTRV